MYWQDALVYLQYAKKNKTLKNKTKCFAVPTSQIHFFLHPHLLFGFLCVFWKFDFMQYWIKLIRVIFLCVLKPKVPTLKSNVIHILKKKTTGFPFQSEEACEQMEGWRKDANQIHVLNKKHKKFLREEKQGRRRCYIRAFWRGFSSVIIKNTDKRAFSCFEDIKSVDTDELCEI